MPELLLELLSEEIPARMQARAADDLKRLVRDGLKKAGLEFESAQAFVEAVEASRFVGPNGVQILGGHRYMRDYPVEKYMRESRVLGLLLGGVDAAREQAGHALIDTGAPVVFSRGEVS